MLRLVLFNLVVFLAVGCSSQDLPFVYRQTIQQGNVLDPEAVAALEQGMSRRQVRFLLGTPSIDDPFHRQRWDYIYLLQEPGEPVERRRLSLFFEQDRLTGAEGNALPPDSPLRRPMTDNGAS